jgi:hypothetical protein
VEIVATGVEMICTETTLALNIDDCRNVTLRGLTIDYDPLPFTQGRITALGEDKSWIEFEIFDGYPDQELERRIQIFDQKTHELKRGDHWDWQPFESLGDRKYRVSKGDGYRFNPSADLEEVGDILVTNNNYAPGGRIPHAIVTSRSSGLVLEDIRLFASNCFSYLEYNCDGTTYRRCSIDRRPPGEDLQLRALERIRSSNADAFHSKHAIRGPQIIDCTAKWMGDDAVNICGEYYMVMAAKNDTLRILSTRETNLSAGDPVELVSYTGERHPDARITNIQPDGVVNEEEVAFLQAQRMNIGTKDGLSQSGTKAYAITLDRQVDLPMGSVIASMNHTGNGFLVEGCDFGYNRSRGILIKGSNGRVANNRLHGNWGPAILVSPEWWWLESGSSNNVEISGNTISDCRDASILVTAHGGTGEQAPAGAHNRIEVRDNTISSARLPAVFIGSVKDGNFQGNTLQLSALGEPFKLVNNESFDVGTNTVSQPAPDYPPLNQ